MKLPGLINKIELLQLELKEYQPLPAERQEMLDKKIRLEFNYNSNHIEGNTLTYGETMLYLIFDKTTGDHDGREYEEMRASDVALKLVQELASDKQRPLTEAFIKNLNEIILVRPYWANAITPDGQHTRRLITVGDYKKHPNSVKLQNGEMFHYASPQETPSKMGDLIQWYKEESEKKELHPVALAALLHYKFVLIHPFDDGNGRISRLLMNYVLYYYRLPPVIIKSANKKDYLLALNKADSGDLDSFVEYVAEQMLWSLEISINAAKGENIDEPGDLEKKLNQLKRRLGKEDDKKIELKRNPEVVKEVIEKSIIPFIDQWEEKLKEFDPLFFSRSCRATVQGKSIVMPSLRNAFEALYNQIGKASIEFITLYCGFSNLRSLKVKSNYNGGSISFVFHQNAYEVEFSGAHESISKLYHQFLTADEINYIVSIIGNWFYNYIEKEIEKKQN